MAPSASQIWKTVRPHIPLIKFRKGGNVQKASGFHPTGPSSAAVSGGGYVDETQLPPKYARKPPTQNEIDYINRGGPE